jgi:hypothetical protein
VLGRIVGRAIDLDQHEARGIIGLLDHVEAGDARLFDAVLRVLDGRSDEGFKMFRLDVDEYVDDVHASSLFKG